ncbi:hypothetical protein PRIPAC_91204 [Pristionchus pacificus]|uniref:Uncharacterized protein n=1 Tax=Pristionchus pacificus TaxID=54126 RepID=A0A2A6B8G4_PRIPA|nr:hypothetical protein PRIPAC_91204 [Pristionchus pacificus]|eukprot:PDM62172.1 hypothetical protein PRIPAC_51614 [Pristionchus pacificus]
MLSRRSETARERANRGEARIDMADLLFTVCKRTRPGLSGLEKRCNACWAAVFVSTVAGMCFDNKSVSAPREVFKPAHTVESIGCKTACWSSVGAACLAFTYNPLSSKCALLGAVKEGICAGKGFYPYVKCAATVNCDYFGEKPASFATNGGISEFPRCHVKIHVAYEASITDVCGAPPPEIVCEHSQCFCRNPNQQLVVKAGPFTYCGVRAHCSERNMYKILSRDGSTKSLPFSISNGSHETDNPNMKAFDYHSGSAVCITIARTSYEKCMCDIPMITGGIRDGDKLCGDKKMKFWADEMGHLSLIISLQCTPDGWSDGAKIVKPEYVRCEKFA